MKRLSKSLPLIALLMLLPEVSHAQVIFSENYSSYPLGNFVPPAAVANFSGFNPNGAATIVTPGQGGSGQAMQFDYDVLQGSGALNTNVMAPFPAPGSSTDTNFADYQVDFDFKIAAGSNTGWFGFVELYNTTTGGFKQAALNVAGATPGGAFIHQSFNLNDMPTPFGAAFDATVPTWGVRLVALGFPPGATAAPHETLQLDNVTVTHVSAPLTLVVDPATGKARIKNTGTSSIDFDYYHIDSDNAALLTANFNGTTGWKSLHDQGISSLGGGVGQSWDEVDTNSSSRLVEQFLLGTTTLAVGQSVGLGAPINPTLLNNQIGSLHFHIGGPAYTAEAFANVQFQSLPNLIGDYNDNGVVDAADYTVWRDHLGQTFSLPNRDSLNTGAISAADYTSWKTHFGQSFGAGNGSAAGVPEPTTALLGILAICLVGSARLHRMIRGNK